MADKATETETTNPWDSDLEAAFTDEGQRTAVSEFLAANVQPYVTKLEQESKPERDATLLWEQFHEAPADTLIQVTRELYGDERADALAGQLTGEPEAPTAEPEAGNEGNEPTTPETTTEGIKFDDLPPEVKEFIAQGQQNKQREQYYGEIERIANAHAEELPKDEDGKPKLDADVFHPFVIAADGNFDAAYDGFTKWVGQAKETFGINVPDAEAVAAAAEGKTPPPTIDSKTRDSQAPAPVVKENATLDDALDDMFSELNAPPPTVGAV
jgi:hypothetical protein